MRRGSTLEHHLLGETNTDYTWDFSCHFWQDNRISQPLADDSISEVRSVTRARTIAYGFPGQICIKANVIRRNIQVTLEKDALE